MGLEVVLQPPSDPETLEMSAGLDDFRASFQPRIPGHTDVTVRASDVPELIGVDFQEHLTQH